MKAYLWHFSFAPEGLIHNTGKKEGAAIEEHKLRQTVEQLKKIRNNHEMKKTMV